MSKDLNVILQGWPSEPGVLRARKFVAEDGQHFIQLRVDLGVLQMAVDGRPDGERPDGYETMLEAVREQIQQSGTPIDDDQQVALGREMLQFYRRRISLMALAKQAHKADDIDQADSCYRRAIRDANHNLQILDLFRERGATPGIEEHEQYRPFILMHLATCRAERALLLHDPDRAIEHLKAGIAAIRACQEEFREDADVGIDVSPFVKELSRFERRIRQRYRRKRTLNEQLADAIAAENFEQAARIRDALAARPRDDH